MKSKKFDKKLNLNKKTVANLNRMAMNEAYGGYKPKPSIPFCIETNSCPTNNSDAGGACCCGDPSFNIC